MPFHWTCPYCDRDTTITDTHQTNYFTLTLTNAEGPRYFPVHLVVCPNPQCKKFTLDIWKYVYKTAVSGGATKEGEALQHWRLIPSSYAKVFPDYIPQAIRDDYVEACQIRDLSPKASATLSRRCLQGMIRDFWKISKGRLIDEIEAIKDKVDPDAWSAIDAVRKIGNIGAHMEKDINVIVDVDNAEAQKLIELIELLMKDWYITRFQRQERLKAIIQVKDAKDAAKAGSVATKP